MAKLRKMTKAKGEPSISFPQMTFDRGITIEIPTLSGSEIISFHDLFTITEDQIIPKLVEASAYSVFFCAVRAEMRKRVRMQQDVLNAVKASVQKKLLLHPPVDPEGNYIKLTRDVKLIWIDDDPDYRDALQVLREMERLCEVIDGAYWECPRFHQALQVLAQEKRADQRIDRSTSPSVDPAHKYVSRGVRTPVNRLEDDLGETGGTEDAEEGNGKY